MLVHADWVLPVSSAPIRDGAVRVCDGLVQAVGTCAELQRAHPTEELFRHDGCTLLPGLVNVHTHLALTALRGVVSSRPFHEWLPLLVRANRVLTPDDHAASTLLGAHRCMASGTTVVGEIAYGPESPATAADTGLGGVFFREALGAGPESVSALLAEVALAQEHPRSTSPRPAPRQRDGISPHAPYTSGPALLRAAHEGATELGIGYAIHVAESPAETRLLRDGSGPLAPIAERNAPDLSPSGVTPVRYLSDLGVLDGALAIHCAEATVSDVDLLARKVAGVALCPRSNAYLHVGPAPVDALLSSGVMVGVGTDSLASNDDLDLFSEARALASLATTATPERIVRIMTAEGAAALGLADRFGSLEPGKQADLAVFAVEGGEDPYAALLQHAGRSTIVSVLAGGTWRVRSGAAVFASRFAEIAVQNAAARASIALG